MENITETFEEMDLPRNLLKGIYGYGWEKPSAIQKRGICAIKEKKDVIIQGESGTGKTGTFAIPILSMIKTDKKYTQALIISPTRELATQITKVFNELGQYVEFSIMTIVGGDFVNKMINDLEKNTPQIIVGTVGRINDLLEKRKININNLAVICLDEADELLSEGFRFKIYDIFKRLKDNVQAVIVSATLNHQDLEIINKFTRDPIKILLKKEQITLEGISQYFVDVGADKYKLACLYDLYKNINISQAIIYVNKVDKSEWLTEEMTKEGYTVSCINGVQTQEHRNTIINQFRSGKTRVLIATDLLARGIDVQHVNLVINYDIPNQKNIANYIHRIGRSGRYGRKGAAINLITKRNYKALEEIEGYYQCEISELPEDLKKII